MRIRKYKFSRPNHNTLFRKLLVLVKLVYNYRPRLNMIQHQLPTQTPGPILQPYFKPWVYSFCDSRNSLHLNTWNVMVINRLEHVITWGSTNIDIEIDLFQNLRIRN